MSNLQKFDSTLAEFDKEVSKLKSIGEVHQEIKKLANDYETVVSKIQESNKTLQSVLKQHQDFQDKIESKYDQNRSDIQTLLKAKLDEIKSQNEAFEKSLTKLVEGLQKDNKQFYRDFEGTMRIKLDENKSEIKQIIENEATKLKETFTAELDKQLLEVVSRQKTAFTASIISLVVIVLILIFIVVKLMR